MVIKGTRINDSFVIPKEMRLGSSTRCRHCDRYIAQPHYKEMGYCYLCYRRIRISRVRPKRLF